MLRSMFAGLAGLSNNQTGLDVVGNNIANVNTVGYKSSKIEFTELLNQTIRGASSPQEAGVGGTNPIQVGLGVGTSAISVSHQQGNLLSTGIMSDLALQGNGFFILGDGGSQTFFSRAGSFTFDADGSLVHSSGMKAYGWMANANGVIDRNSSITNLSIPVGQTISANATTGITYAYNLDSRAYTIGTPVLASGNSANIAIVSGKFTGNEDDPATVGIEPTIIDVKGTHTINVYAETHNGVNTSLNGTQTLGDDIGVQSVVSFRVVIDGQENTINLSNGTSSTVNELVSAINSQLPGVTAILNGGKIMLTRDTAGLNNHIYVYDDNLVNDTSFFGLSSTGGSGATVTLTEADDIWDYLVGQGYVNSSGQSIGTDANIALLDLSVVPNASGIPAATWDFSDLEVAARTILTEAKNGHINSSNGIAAKCFGSGSAEWLPASKALGTKATQKLTTALTGLDITNDLIVSHNGITSTFEPDDTANPAARTPLAATDTIADLIREFNLWSESITAGTTNDKFYMGLNQEGKLFVTYETADNDTPISIDDTAATNNGIADLFFAGAGGNDWGAEITANAANINFNRLSTTAYLDHTFARADGGGTYVLPIDFDPTDTRITGIDGVTITADTAGFKTGRFIMQTVAPTEHVTSTTVYDSLGKERTITLTLSRTDDNTWNWDASGIEVTGSGSLVFDNLGILQRGATSGTIAVGSQGGSNSLTIVPDFTSITQYADSSTMVHSAQDGYPNGSLSSYSISSDGVIIGIYSNGLNQDIAQIGVATFNNPTGLLKGSDGMFITSNNSGEPQIGTANTGGRGTISAGTLEMSNVDIAEEFANMIIYQRGFQANSKIITTADEILQTLVNMKR